MSLTNEEIESYIEQICVGSKIVEVKDIILLLKFPTIYDKILSRRVYEAGYKEALKEGLLSNGDMQKIIEERGFINEKDKLKLSSLKSKLEAQKVLLARTTRVRANQDRIKEVIFNLEKEIREIEYKEKSKFAMTADTKAEESRVLYLCWSGCYDFDMDKRHWSSYEDFIKEQDYEFRQKVTSEFIVFYMGVPTSVIRQIARHNLWRIRYINSLKTSEQLFGRPIVEYTNDMLNLTYWSNFYQSIYDMLPEDQPSNDIIDDDEALDAYLKDYYDERHNEAVSRRHNNPRRGKLSAFDKEEVLVTRTNELYDDIKFDDPKEARSIKNRTDIRKRTRHS